MKSNITGIAGILLALTINLWTFKLLEFVVPTGWALAVFIPALAFSSWVVLIEPTREESAVYSGLRCSLLSVFILLALWFRLRGHIVLRASRESGMVWFTPISGSFQIVTTQLPVGYVYEDARGPGVDVPMSSKGEACTVEECRKHTVEALVTKITGWGENPHGQVVTDDAENAVRGSTNSTTYSRWWHPLKVTVLW